jgi:hypothetical protein
VVRNFPRFSLPGGIITCCLKSGEVENGCVFEMGIFFAQELCGIECVSPEHRLIPAGGRVICIFRVCGGGQRRAVFSKSLGAGHPGQPAQDLKWGCS